MNQYSGYYCSQTQSRALQALNYTQRFNFGQFWLSSGLNLVVVVLGLFALSQAFLLLSGTDKHVAPQKVISIPNWIIGVMVLMFSFVEVYSLRNSLSDCLIATGFGLFGAILKRLNIPIVPIIRGMDLDGIMEAKFSSAMTRIQSSLDILDRPISAVLVLAIIGLLLLGLKSAVQH